MENNKQDQKNQEDKNQEEKNQNVTAEQYKEMIKSWLDADEKINSFMKALKDLKDEYDSRGFDEAALKASLAKHIVDIKAVEIKINIARGEFETLKDNLNINQLNAQKVNKENMQYAKLYEEGKIILFVNEHAKYIIYVVFV